MAGEPDIEQIRAALAAATLPDKPWSGRTERDYDKADRFLRANAPVWLAQLCDEIERLRTIQSVDADYLGTIDQVVAERDAALAECERLRAELEAKS